MFIESIEKVAAYTRPIHSIMRTYSGKQIIPGSATIFFINENGYAVTCKHVIDLLASSDKCNKSYSDFKAERDKLPRDSRYKRSLRRLEIKYKYNTDTTVEIKNTFLDCVDSMSGFTWKVHPDYDLAYLKFNDFKAIHYKDYAVFRKDHESIKQGEFLCRLGFPFPEFSNFQYNIASDTIEWTNQGTKVSPRFPLEGMVTRFLAEKNVRYGIELSTPGLKGQSGGPLFDEKGLVCGMQFSTKHLHLGFDLIDKEIMVNNKLTKVSDYSFVHLGQCIHAEIIKNFLKENSIKFYEG